MMSSASHICPHTTNGLPSSGGLPRIRRAPGQPSASALMIMRVFSIRFGVRQNQMSGLGGPRIDVVPADLGLAPGTPACQEVAGGGVLQSEVRALARLLLDDHHRAILADQLLAALEDVILVALAVELDQVELAAELVGHRPRLLVEGPHHRLVLAALIGDVGVAGRGGAGVQGDRETGALAEGDLAQFDVLKAIELEALDMGRDRLEGGDVGEHAGQHAGPQTDVRPDIDGMVEVADVRQRHQELAKLVGRAARELGAVLKERYQVLFVVGKPEALDLFHRALALAIAASTFSTVIACIACMQCWHRRPMVPQASSPANRLMWPG